MASYSPARRQSVRTSPRVPVSAASIAFAAQLESAANPNHWVQQPFTSHSNASQRRVKKEKNPANELQQPIPTPTTRKHTRSRSWLSNLLKPNASLFPLKQVNPAKFDCDNQPEQFARAPGTKVPGAPIVPLPKKTSTNTFSGTLKRKMKLGKEKESHENLSVKAPNRPVRPTVNSDQSLIALRTPVLPLQSSQRANFAPVRDASNSTSSESSYISIHLAAARAVAKHRSLDIASSAAGNKLTSSPSAGNFGAVWENLVQEAEISFEEQDGEEIEFQGFRNQARSHVSLPAVTSSHSDYFAADYSISSSTQTADFAHDVSLSAFPSPPLAAAATFAHNPQYTPSEAECTQFNSFLPRNDSIAVRRGQPEKLAPLKIPSPAETNFVASQISNSTSSNSIYSIYETYLNEKNSPAEPNSQFSPISVNDEFQSFSPRVEGYGLGVSGVLAREASDALNNSLPFDPNSFLHPFKPFASLESSSADSVEQTNLRAPASTAFTQTSFEVSPYQESVASFADTADTAPSSVASASPGTRFKDSASTGGVWREVSPESLHFNETSESESEVDDVIDEYSQEEETIKVEAYTRRELLRRSVERRSRWIQERQEFYGESEIEAIQQAFGIAV